MVGLSTSSRRPIGLSGLQGGKEERGEVCDLTNNNDEIRKKSILARLPTLKNGNPEQILTLNVWI